MPLRTLERWLGLSGEPDPWNAPLVAKGLRLRTRGLWAGYRRGLLVEVERHSADGPGWQARVHSPVALTLGPGGPHHPPTGDGPFDEVFGLPHEEHAYLAHRDRRDLVALSGFGQVGMTDGALHLTSIRPDAFGTAWSAIERMLRVVDGLRQDEEDLDRLARLRRTDRTEALALARQLRSRRTTSPRLRDHAEALIRRGRRLLPLVLGRNPPLARRWAAEHLPDRYVDDVVDELVARQPRNAGDVQVLAALTAHPEVALLLAHHEGFWAAELDRVLPLDHREALADLIAALAKARPEPWVDQLLRWLPGQDEPVVSAGLSAVAAHGSHRALLRIGQVLNEQGGPHEARWKQARAALRVRFDADAGGLSIASTGGDLTLVSERKG